MMLCAVTPLRQLPLFYASVRQMSTSIFKMGKKNIRDVIADNGIGNVDASEKGLVEVPTTIASKASYHLSSLSTRLATGLTFICLTVSAIHYFAPTATTFPSVNLNFFPWDPPTCPAPKPNVFGYHPPRPSNELLMKASKGLDDWLAKTVSQNDIDSLSIAVVTPAGPIFEKGYGVLRANETEAEEPNPVDRESIYRIASVSKMFAVLETLILRERGVLNWDDPIEKYLPEISPPSYSWSDHLRGTADLNNIERERTTLRQLASHLSGIGRDYPPIDLPEWPPRGPIKVVKTWPNYTNIVDSVSKYPLVNLPWSYPIYSNTGIGILGLANVAANKLASAKPESEPQSHEELLKRDIFGPLGLTGSFFNIPDSSSKSRVAVPKQNSEWADFSFGDAFDPAGGQYSSLADLELLMQTLLSPSARGGVISANMVREWLRPLHVWGATKQEVGAPWEVLNLDNKVQAYTKSGDLPGYHSEFALIPEYSYGIIVLLTGSHRTTPILTEVTKRLHPVLNRLYQIELERRYAGTWVSGDGKGIAEITLDKGKNTLFVKKLFVLGEDALKSVHEQGLIGGVRGPGPSQVALWTTGRVGEFRLAFGVPSLNKVPGIGCFPYWVTIDPGLNSRGAPIDLLYWDRGYLVYPSAGVRFTRIR